MGRKQSFIFFYFLLAKHSYKHIFCNINRIEFPLEVEFRTYRKFEKGDVI